MPSAGVRRLKPAANGAEASDRRRFRVVCSAMSGTPTRQRKTATPGRRWVPPPCPATRPREEEGARRADRSPKGPRTEHRAREEEGTAARSCDAPQGGGGGPPHALRSLPASYLVAVAPGGGVAPPPSTECPGRRRGLLYPSILRTARPPAGRRLVIAVGGLGRHSRDHARADALVFKFAPRQRPQLLKGAPIDQPPPQHVAKHRHQPTRAVAALRLALMPLRSHLSCPIRFLVTESTGDVRPAPACRAARAGQSLLTHRDRLLLRMHNARKRECCYAARSRLIRGDSDGGAGSSPVACAA